MILDSFLAFVAVGLLIVLIALSVIAALYLVGTVIAILGSLLDFLTKGQRS